MGVLQDILRLKRERNAVILAHNYQLPEVQDVADFVGDSLELSIKAMRTDAKYIVFAGVDFMAEQAAILAGVTGKVVLHPEPDSRCPMAAMITPEDIRRARRKWPGLPVVVYVNSPASVKAEADYVVTSSSAVKLVSQLDSDAVIFGPDVNLASYVAEVTGKEVYPVPERSFCPVHVVINAEYLRGLVGANPDAEVVVHPECVKEVRSLANYVGSTSQMVKYVKSRRGSKYIIGTEIGLIHRLRREAPGREFLPASPSAVCVNMKKITAEKVLKSLKELIYPVEVPEGIRVKVLEVLERSFELLGVDVPWRKY